MSHCRHPQQYYSISWARSDCTEIIFQKALFQQTVNSFVALPLSYMIVKIICRKF